MKWTAYIGPQAISVGRFDEFMTAGKGFIGLAAMIFGKWNPVGAFASSMIFGLLPAAWTIDGC